MLYKGCNRRNTMTQREARDCHLSFLSAAIEGLQTRGQHKFCSLSARLCRCKWGGIIFYLCSTLPEAAELGARGGHAQVPPLPTRLHDFLLDFLNFLNQPERSHLLHHSLRNLRCTRLPGAPLHPHLQAHIHHNFIAIG